MRLLSAAWLCVGCLVLSGCSGEVLVKDASTPITVASADLSCADATSGEVEPTKVYDDSQAALDGWLAAKTPMPALDEGVTFKIQIEQVGRTLYSAADGADPVAAVITQARVVGENGDRGWSVISWARCPAVTG